LIVWSRGAESPGTGEHIRRLVAERRVGAVGVVVLAPVFDDDDGFGEAAELLEVEEFVAGAAVEGFDVGVLPRRSGLDERGLGPRVATPVSEGVGGQFRAVVAAHVLGRAAQGGEPFEDGDGLVCVDASGDVHRERFAGEFVDDVEQFDDAAVGGLIELEIERPDVVGPLGPQPISGHGRFPEPAAFAALGRDPEAFLAPQPLHPLAVDLVAELAEANMRAAVAPPRPLGRERPEQRAQRCVGVGGVGLVAMGGAVLADELAGPALANAEALLQVQDRSAPAGWAQKFPFASSLSACSRSA
jgi:hypothetical protein